MGANQMAKVNYNQFPSFDLNEACDFFDSEKQSNWKKIGKFIIADGQEFVNVMEKDFDFEDTAEGEYAAFEAGVRYALAKMNIALDAADLPLEVAEVDLVESMGFMLVRTDDTPESFVKRVMKKPVVMVESWVD
jgi:hypothetical protein